MIQSVIKDPIWGEIALLPWEKVLLNTGAFNRLHKILQNSNVYRVYPSARHSRFSHSLGVMYVTTRITTSIFRNHFILSRNHIDIREDTDLDCKCSEGLLLECESIRDQFSATGGDSEHLREEISRVNFPYRTHPELHLTVCVMRMCALLHDVGHLPYSHVFESAFELFFATDKKGEEFEKTFEEDVAIHEQVGGWIMTLLASCDPHTDPKNDEAKELRVLVSVAYSVLHEKKYPILKSIISGISDADRIDYIRRDCELTGFIKSSVDYDRLFRNFHITFLPDILKPEKSGAFHAIPSKKAKSDFEKMLWERYQEYMYIVDHHRVVLFDEITRRLICYLLRREKLEKFLDGLTYVKKSFEKKSDRETPTVLGDSSTEYKALIFLQYYNDDGVVDEKFKSILREFQTPKKLKKLKLTDFEKAKYDCLAKAFCEKRDLFVSAFKTDAEFWVWCEEITKCSNKNPEIETVITNIMINLSPKRIEKVEQAVFEDAECAGAVILLSNSLRKKQIGLGNTNTIVEFELAGLSDFLESKKRGIRIFNMWIERTSGFDVETIKKVTARYLEMKDPLPLFNSLTVEN